VLALPHEQTERCQRWRRAAELLLDQADVAAVSRRGHLRADARVDRRLVAGAGEQAPTESQLTPMALTMRPTGLGSGIDKDRQDYTVYTGGWDIGRIYEVRGGPDHLRWFWSCALYGPMTHSDRVATLEEAKAQFPKTWDAWKAWAKLEEAP
jgi:hypothetical protein